MILLDSFMSLCLTKQFTSTAWRRWVYNLNLISSGHKINRASIIHLVYLVYFTLTKICWYWLTRPVKLSYKYNEVFSALNQWLGSVGSTRVCVCLCAHACMRVGSSVNLCQSWHGSVMMERETFYKTSEFLSK